MTPSPVEDSGTIPEASEAIPSELFELPRELGVLLLVAGVAGLILPGPMGTPALLAGGFVLWPGASGRFACWLERRHPSAYRQSVGQIRRFLDDIERRYPSPKTKRKPKRRK
jgi:hypothetical protein